MTQTFTAHAAALKRALAFAMQRAERWSTIPILTAVRIDAIGGLIAITGTDLDIEVEAHAEAISGDDFSLTIAPQFLMGLLRWAEGEVKISRAGDMITIEADDVVATVREVCPVVDWPRVNRGRARAVPFTLTDAKLRKALRATSACISREETRYYLNGVWFAEHDGSLRMVATDGRRMAIYDTGEEWHLPGMIVPRITAQLLLRALPEKSNGSVAVTGYESNFVQFAHDGWIIRSKLIDGTFPDYSRVVPTPADDISVTISAAALRRFPPSSERSRAVMIDGDAGRMTHQEPDGARVQMPVQGRGKAFGVNLGYLRDFANIAGVMRLEGRSPGDPFRVLTDDPAFLGVQMPMRV